MDSRTTFSVLFYLRKSRINKQGESPIYLRITVGKQYSVISVNRYIHPKFWDQSKGYANYRATDADSINILIDQYRKRVYDAHKQLLDANNIVTAKDITK